MKKAIAIIFLMSCLISCKKEGISDTKPTVQLGDPLKDTVAFKMASRDPDQTNATSVTLTTVVLNASYVFQFTWVWNSYVNSHGGGNYNMSGGGGQFANGSSSYLSGQTITWTNYANSTLIYITIKGKDSYLVPIKMLWYPYESNVTITMIYNVRTCTYTGTSTSTPAVKG